MWRPRVIDAAVMAALVLAMGTITIAFGERIGINGGQGWDGMGYTMWARDFWHLVVQQGLTRFYSQRILPSAIVYTVLRESGIALTVPHVIKAFLVLNTLLLTTSAILWAHLGHALKLRRAAIWVGFVALFGSHANLRHALYYPTLTDPMAFTLGMAIVWAYLTERPIALWFLTLASAFTWPALPIVGVTLLVVPRQQVTAPGMPRWLALAISVALAAGFLLVAWHYLHHVVPGVGDEKFAQWVHRDLLVVTMASLGAFLVLGWYFLLRERSLFRIELRWKRTVIAVLAAIAIFILRALWIAKVGIKGEGPPGAQFLCEHTLAAIRGPLWGPVHHVVYFGPIVLVGYLAWPRVARTAASWGPPAVLALAFAVAFAAGSNSRQWNHLVPFFVTATIVSTNELWTRGRAIVFAAITLVWSKLWLKIGYDQPGHWHQFPNQRYFMNHGPYANDTMYLVHFAVAVVTLGLLWWLIHARDGTGTGDLVDRVQQ